MLKAYRLIAGIVACLFSFQSSVWSLSAMAFLPSPGIKLAIPSNLGTLEALYVPLASEEIPPVIHLQDAHASPEAQERIRDLLAWLEKKRPLVVALEGSLGELHPEYLDLVPDYPEVNDRVARDLVKEGLLSGAELFAWEKYQQSLRARQSAMAGEAISGPGLRRRPAKKRGEAPRNDIQFIGVETPRLYRANLRAYREFFKDEAEVTKWLRESRRKLESREAKTLNPALRKFLREVERRKDGNFGTGIQSPNLAAFVRFLADSAYRELQIDLRDRFEQIRFPNLTRLLAVIAPQGLSRSFKRNIMEGIASPAKRERLPAGRQEAISSHALTSRQRAILQSEVDSKGLFQEMEILEKGVREKLVRGPAELQLLDERDRFKLLEKLFRLELTKEEYRVILRPTGPKDLRFFVPTPADPAGVGAQNDEAVHKSYRIALRFYHLAERRDRVLLENALREAKRLGRDFKKTPTLVLITGGFHTEGLTHLLRERGIPHAVVSPRLTQTQDGKARYHDLMTGRWLSSHLKLALPTTGRPQYEQLDNLGGQDKVFTLALSEARAHLERLKLPAATLDRLLENSGPNFGRAETRQDEPSQKSVPQDISDFKESLRQLAWNLMSELPSQWELWQAVAEAIDQPELYHQFRSLPIPLLRYVETNNLWERLISNRKVVRLLERQKRDFDLYMNRGKTWITENASGLGGRTVAYLSAEYGLQSPDPAIYSGGLGILSGDHLRGASDLGLKNFVGVGLLYERGYFRQRITPNGQQADPVYESSRGLNRDELPLEEVKRPGSDQPLILDIPFPNGTGTVKAKVWRMRYGKAQLILLDTNIPENPSPEDRAITDNVYRFGSGTWQRLEQYFVLGVGGMMALKELGIRPDVIHLNEGHTFFAALQAMAQIMEDLKDRVQDPRLRFEMAYEQVRAKTVFTTHTPIAAGNELFSDPTIRPFIEKIFVKNSDSNVNGFAADRLMSMGIVNQNFNLTAFSLRISSHYNAVSARHGEVARSMWKFIDPGVLVKEVPIDGIVNSVHTGYRTPLGGYWQTRKIAGVFQHAFNTQEVQDVIENPDWRLLEQRMRDETWGSWVDTKVPVKDEALWGLHRSQKKELFQSMIRRFLASLEKRPGDDLGGLKKPDQDYLSYLESFDPEALTIGFARRFIDYKRALLILDDLKRLEVVCSKTSRPVQIIFAGKAHPKDEKSKAIIEELHRRMEKMREGGKIKIVFILEYNIGLARRLEAGVDVWLNNPVRPLEASGTSGQKAAANGVLNLSTRDGWVLEGIVHGKNGWLFGAEEDVWNDAADREALYEVLEKEVIPLWETPGKKGWIRMMKSAILTASYRFGMERMLSEYVQRKYQPAAAGGEAMTVEVAEAKARRRLEKRDEILKVFNGSHRPSLKVERNYSREAIRGEFFPLHAVVDLKGLKPEDFGMDLRARKVGASEAEGVWYGMNVSREELGGGKYRFTAMVQLPEEGEYEFSVRVTPRDQVSWSSAAELASVTLWQRYLEPIRAYDGKLLEYRADPQRPPHGMLFSLYVPTGVPVDRVFWTSQAFGWHPEGQEMEKIGENRWAVVVDPQRAPTGYYEFLFYLKTKDGRMLPMTGNYQTLKRDQSDYASSNFHHRDPLYDRAKAGRLLEKLKTQPRGDPKLSLLQVAFEDLSVKGRIYPQSDQPVRLAKVEASFSRRFVDDPGNFIYFVHWGFRKRDWEPLGDVRNIKMDVYVMPGQDAVILKAQFEVPPEGNPQFKIVAVPKHLENLQIVGRPVAEWGPWVIWSGRGEYQDHSFQDEKAEPFNVVFSHSDEADSRQVARAEARMNGPVEDNRFSFALLEYMERLKEEPSSASDEEGVSLTLEALQRAWHDKEDREQALEALVSVLLLKPAIGRNGQVVRLFRDLLDDRAPSRRLFARYLLPVFLEANPGLKSELEEENRLLLHREREFIGNSDDLIKRGALNTLAGIFGFEAKTWGDFLERPVRGGDDSGAFAPKANEILLLGLPWGVPPQSSGFPLEGIRLERMKASTLFRGKSQQSAADLFKEALPYLGYDTFQGAEVSLYQYDGTVVIYFRPVYFLEPVLPIDGSTPNRAEARSGRSLETVAKNAADQATDFDLILWNFFDKDLSLLEQEKGEALGLPEVEWWQYLKIFKRLKETLSNSLGKNRESRLRALGAFKEAVAGLYGLQNTKWDNTEAGIHKVSERVQDTLVALHRSFPGDSSQPQVPKPPQDENQEARALAEQLTFQPPLDTLVLVDDANADSLLVKIAKDYYSDLLQVLGRPVRIELVASGETGLERIPELIAEGRNPLVITDYSMPPGMDGLKMIELLQQRGVQTPFILRSYKDLEARLRGFPNVVFNSRGESDKVHEALVSILFSRAEARAIDQKTFERIKEKFLSPDIEITDADEDWELIRKMDINQLAGMAQHLSSRSDPEPGLLRTKGQQILERRREKVNLIMRQQRQEATFQSSSDPRAETRVALASTKEWRERAEVQLTGLARRLGDWIEKRLGRSRARLGTHGFLRLPTAEAAEAGWPQSPAARKFIDAGTLLRFATERSHSESSSIAGISAIEMELLNSRLGISSISPRQNTALVLLPGAALEGERPLLPVAGEMMRANPQIRAAGILVPNQGWSPFIQRERVKLLSGQDLLEAGELSELVTGLLRLKVTEVKIIASVEDSLIAGELLRLLRGRGIHAELMPAVTEDWVNQFIPWTADKIEHFREETRSLRTAA